MYNRSQSGLEYITTNSANYAAMQPLSSRSYSITASTSSYHDGMFIPSRDTFFVYYPSGKEKSSYSIQQEKYNFILPQAEYHFVPGNFLKPGKEGIFVGKAEEVKEFVEETFAKIFQQPFPNNIKMSILNQEEFSKVAPLPGTIGLSLNRGQAGLLSEIFILNDTLGRVMLTIGHELGHVLTKTLQNSHDEEAKAYAFSLLWMKVIKGHNIADLAEAIIVEQPAENGLHNVSFQFVHQLVFQGREVEEIYNKLVAGELSLSIPL